MKIFIASDHAGLEMKKRLIAESGLDFIDLGTNSAESCDYPIFANKLCDEVLKTENGRGVLICSAGVGMSIAANRRMGIRAALCFDEKIAEFSRRHNDANVIVFGSSVTSVETALNYLKIFLKTGFDGGRHERRLKLIDQGRNDGF
jgi:ribose 5-phosphate isomerase B